MNKSVLALTTALSIFAASSAFAQNTAPATADPMCVDQATNMLKLKGTVDELERLRAYIREMEEPR